MYTQWLQEMCKLVLTAAESFVEFELWFRCQSLKFFDKLYSKSPLTEALPASSKSQTQGNKGAKP